MQSALASYQISIQVEFMSSLDIIRESQSLVWERGTTWNGMRALNGPRWFWVASNSTAPFLPKEASTFSPVWRCSSGLLEEFIVTSSETVISYTNSSSPAFHPWSFIPCRLVTSSRSSMPLGTNLKSQTQKEKIHKPKELQDFAKSNVGKNLENLLSILPET